MANKLADFIRQAETWPAEAQEQALASLQAIEDELRRPYELSEEDRQAIDRGLADAAAGRFASEEEIERLFARWRSR